MILKAGITALFNRTETSHTSHTEPGGISPRITSAGSWMPYSLPHLENYSVRTALASSEPLLLEPRAPMEEVHTGDFSECGSTNSYDQGILDRSGDKSRMVYINRSREWVIQVQPSWFVVVGRTTIKRANTLLCQQPAFGTP